MRIIDKILEARKELSDKQKKLDKNDNGKIDSEDLKTLRTKRDDVYTSDYKLDKKGHKTKAHKISFKAGEEEVKEEHMSPDQMKKREKIVKGMKKSYRGFIQRYGKDRAKSVMYATATKQAMKEDTEMNEAVTVDKKNYSWGKMMTVHHGSENSYPLHPDHQDAIKKLKDGEHTSFKDETNRNVTAHREGDNVHLSGKGSNKKTTIAHSHFTEETFTEGLWPGTPEYKKKFDNDRVTGAGARHDIEKTATGVRATRRFSDNDTAEKPKDAPKRGRGRPKKDKFAEAVEFLVNLDEETFDCLMEEGFDSFFETYQSLDEISKTTLASYVKKANKSAIASRKIAGDFEHMADKSRKPSMKTAATALADKWKSRTWKRSNNIEKAVDRLTK